MPPAFPEDDVFNHTLGYIQKAGKEVSQNELMLYIAHVRSNHFSFTCLSKKVSSIR